MQALVISLILVLTCAARAATPFISVGLSPTLIMPVERFNESLQVEDWSFTPLFGYIPEVEAGIAKGSAEYFARFHGGGSFQHIEANSGYEVQQWGKSRLDIGVRRNYTLNTVRSSSLLGAGISVGKSHYKLYDTFTVYSQNGTSCEIVTTDRNASSGVTPGLFGEMGFRFKALGRMLFSPSYRMNLYYATLPKQPIAGEQTYTVIESLLSLSLRWDFERHR